MNEVWHARCVIVARGRAGGRVRSRRPGSGRRDRIRPRARLRATMTLRACHTSFMQTSETYMIRRRARVYQQCDFVLLVTCHTKRDNSGTRRSPEAVWASMKESIANLMVQGIGGRPH